MSSPDSIIFTLFYHHIVTFNNVLTIQGPHTVCLKGVAKALFACSDDEVPCKYKNSR
ncbi:12022_t:CDS:2 [Entrophospora sp. SA101]|nr:12022_t:CDS:2 [Entrophospora sp. SA101]